MNTNMNFYGKITGYIGRDAEIREHNGKKVASFSVCHTEKWTDNNGEQKERANWVKATVWGTAKSQKFPEFVANVAKKGVKVTVYGKPEASAYMGSDGQPKASLEFQITDIDFHTQAGNGGGSSAPAEEQDNDTVDPEDLSAIPF